MRCADVSWREVALMPRFRRLSALLGVLSRQVTEEQALEESTRQARLTLARGSSYFMVALRAAAN